MSMTDRQHPITPPPELVQQWEDDILDERDNVDHVLDCAWKNGFQAGADQELEACCAYLAKAGLTGDACGLQLTRRPKPPSLKNRIAAAITDGDERKALKLLEELDDSL